MAAGSRHRDRCPVRRLGCSRARSSWSFYRASGDAATVDAHGWWATRNGADLMGHAHDLGQVKAGFLADLLVVDGDPLADITLLKSRSNLLAILQNGVFQKNELGALAHASAASRPLEAV